MWPLVPPSMPAPDVTIAILNPTTPMAWLILATIALSSAFAFLLVRVMERPSTDTRARLTTRRTQTIAGNVVYLSHRSTRRAAARLSRAA